MPPCHPFRLPDIELKTRKVNAQRGAAKALDFGVSLTASADKKKQKGTAPTATRQLL
jgi:hypothetical protein